jgi:hypothetical protein
MHGLFLCRASWASFILQVFLTQNFLTVRGRKVFIPNFSNSLQDRIPTLCIAINEFGESQIYPYLFKALHVPCMLLHPYTLHAYDTHNRVLLTTAYSQQLLQVPRQKKLHIFITKIITSLEKWRLLQYAINNSPQALTDPQIITVRKQHYYNLGANKSKIQVLHKQHYYKFSANTT